MTLDEMLGVTDGEDNEFNEADFLARVGRYLRKRTTPDDFEMHFLAFNAISCISDYDPSAETLDLVDSLLDDYIRTSKKEAQADFMLCDLILDHWYPDRAGKHAKTILLETRYRHRRQQFYDLLEFFSRYPRFLLDRELIVEASVNASKIGAKSENGSIRSTSRKVLALLTTPA